MFSRHYEIFFRNWQQGTLHHAWLILGHDVEQMAHLCTAMSYTLLSKQDARGKTQQEQREFTASCPFLLTFDKKENVKAVKEKINAFFHLREETNVRVCLLQNMDCFNVHIHNALLKIIEEPPDHTFFIAYATRLGSIPKTILSRFLQRYAYTPLEGKEKGDLWLDILQKKPISLWINKFYACTLDWKNMQKACLALSCSLNKFICDLTYGQDHAPFPDYAQLLETFKGQQALLAHKLLRIERKIDMAQKVHLSPKSLFFEIYNMLEI